jgi:hypothetical protein
MFVPKETEEALDEEELLFRASLSASPSLAFDIDETLSWTIGWWLERLQTLFGNPEGLSTVEMEKKYKLAQYVPYWQTPEAHAWMEKHRTDNGVQLELPLIAGAVDGVSELFHGGEAAAVPLAGYITVRPRGVKAGTVAWLAEKGFPALPVLTKPDAVPFAEGNAWKGRALGRLWPQISGIVDDNPKVLAGLPPNYPGVLFLFGHHDDPAALMASRPDVKVVHCPTWPSVVAAVRAHRASGAELAL